MANDVVTWERIVSASVSVPAVPLTAHRFGIDDDGKQWSVTEPVVGILTELVETYRRFRKSAYDYGAPKLPPSPESLAAEGYQFDWQMTRVRYLLNDTEYVAPEPLDADDYQYSRVIVLPTGATVPLEWVEDTTKELWAYVAKRAAVRADMERAEQGAK